MKNYLDLKTIALIGRTLKEYQAFFNLDLDKINQEDTILDIGAGVSSFTYKMRQLGYKTFACDPIYQWDYKILAEKCEQDLAMILEKMPAIEDNYNWDFYQDIKGLEYYRKQAYQDFLQDYQNNSQYYIKGNLPKLAFKDKSIAITLVSHLLFLYDQQLDYDFHKQSILELLRITQKTIVIYPIINLKAQPSIFIDKILQDLPSIQFFKKTIDFAFLKGANQVLYIYS